MTDVEATAKKPQVFAIPAAYDSWAWVFDLPSRQGHPAISGLRRTWNDAMHAVCEWYGWQW